MPINQFSSSRRMLPVVLSSLIVLSILPARFTGWVSWFAGLTDALMTPVSDPAAWVSRWMVPAKTGPHDPAIVEQLRAERNQFERMWLAERERRRELEKFVTEGDEDARWTIAQVVGVGADTTSGLLKVRAGSADGVIVDSVATFNADELVGRVVQSLAKTAFVQPITDERAGRLECVIMDDSEAILSCSLKSDGSMVLSGDVEYQADQTNQPSIEKGMLVRLRDPSWPSVASMMIVGEIETVGPSPEYPLRRVVTVRPRTRLDRVRTVRIHIPEGS